MRHRVSVKKFNRTSAHRKAMLSNMLTSLLKYEKIETTKEKGRAIKQLADKIIYRAKTDNIHNRFGDAADMCVVMLCDGSSNKTEIKK